MTKETTSLEYMGIDKEIALQFIHAVTLPYPLTFSMFLHHSKTMSTQFLGAHPGVVLGDDPTSDRTCWLR